MRAKIKKTTISTVVQGHEIILGERGIKLLPENLTVTKFAPGQLSLGGTHAVISGTRILTSGKLGKARHHLYVTVSNNNDLRRQYELDALVTLRVEAPLLAAEIERQAGLLAAIG